MGVEAIVIIMTVITVLVAGGSCSSAHATPSHPQGHTGRREELRLCSQDQDYLTHTHAHRRTQMHLTHTHRHTHTHTHTTHHN